MAMDVRDAETGELLSLNQVCVQTSSSSGDLHHLSVLALSYLVLAVDPLRHCFVYMVVQVEFFVCVFLDCLYEQREASIEDLRWGYSASSATQSPLRRSFTYLGVLFWR
jgi:hypothetical protein